MNTISSDRSDDFVKWSKQLVKRVFILTDDDVDRRPQVDVMGDMLGAMSNQQLHKMSRV